MLVHLVWSDTKKAQDMPPNLRTILVSEASSRRTGTAAGIAATVIFLLTDGHLLVTSQTAAARGGPSIAA
jgi:hypothetical protein